MKTIEELTKRNENLRAKAEEADGLVDQRDEFRHASEKLRKAELQNEKYRNKLEEAAGLRRTIKTFEELNMDLTERMSQLEEDCRTVEQSKSVAEQYSRQIAKSEKTNAIQKEEIEGLVHELEQAKRSLAILESEKADQSESLATLQNKVVEFETLGGNLQAGSIHGEAEDSSMANELEDALSGTTMTALRLQIRRLKRELETAEANKSGASRILELENLLALSKRANEGYEQAGLQDNRDALMLDNMLQISRRGKKDHIDGSRGVSVAKVVLAGG